MLKTNKTAILLLLILTFAFLYRLLLMLWDAYPPGADIGLHNSVIHSITGSGNVNFFNNLYHIGGGISLTFPGYHIFTSSIIFMTGLPEYLAHAVVPSFFSSLLVLCAFLITKRIWSEPAAFIAAFLVAISRFDIEMLLWGGYPNVITLLLIPLTFYLFLQKDRFSIKPFLATTTLLAATIFFTHSLSAIIFVTITIIIALFLILKPNMLNSIRKTGFYWIIPLLFGAILIIPFLAQAVPTYLNNNATLDITGNDLAANAIKLATLSTRVLPLELVLPLVGAMAGFLVFSKKFYCRFITLPTFLLSIWLFVPLTLTLSYLVGIAVDFNRFLYFLILPLIIFIAVLIEYGSSFFAGRINKAVFAKKVSNLKYGPFISSITREKTYTGIIVFFLLVCFLALPIFMGPMYLDYDGELPIQKFYQTMNDPGWDAVQWIKNNTPKDAVLVSDALYGWWLGGFAQRKTLSAVDPQYLSITEEFEKTQFARYLLDTDYIIDNNSTLIPQVRDDGGYISRHNPQILVKQNWTYSPASFFNFNSQSYQIMYRVNDVLQPLLRLNELAVKDTRIEHNQNYASITITRGNNDFNYTVSTTVSQGIRFVNITSTLTSLHSGVSFERVDIYVETKPSKVEFKQDTVTVGFVDVGTKAFGQLIFNTTPAKVDTFSSLVLLTYLLEGKSDGQIQILATAYSGSNNENYYSCPHAIDEYFIPIMAENLNSALSPIEQANRLEVFNYRSEIAARNVSYVVCRDLEIQPKFAKNPLFSLVFINCEVAIFKVIG